MIALEPYNKGLVGTTLRYPYEVRKAVPDSSCHEAKRLGQPAPAKNKNPHPP